MALTTEQQRVIAWKSQSITERLYTQYESDSTPRATCDAITDSSLAEEWVSETHMRDIGQIQNRPAVTDTSPETLCQVANRDAYPEDVPIPDWVTDVNSLIETVTDTAALHVHEFYKDTDDVPFIHFTSSLISYARSQVVGRLTTIPEECLHGLHKQLYHDLTGLISETIFTEYKTYKALTSPGKINADPNQTVKENTGEVEDALYRKFIQSLHTEQRLIDVFTTYPVLPRFIMTRLTQWVDNVMRVDERVTEDWAALAEKYGFGTDDAITRIVTLSSDRHNGGERVVKITVSSGVTFIYKPRGVETNSVFDSTVQVLAENTEVSYPEKTVVVRDGYGYVEYTPPDACENNDAVGTFYERVGCVLAAAYLLHFTDCHYENLIADSAVPRVIDTETVYAPELSFNTTEGHTNTSGVLDTGVLESGLLPQRYAQETIPSEARVNGLSEPKTPVSGKHIENNWAYSNTDYMQLTEQRSGELMTPPADNLPSVDGVTKQPNEYVNEIKRGFRNALQPLTRTAAEKQDVESFIPSEPIPVRVVIRPTQEYARVLNVLQTPDTLQDGKALTYEIDTLTRNIQDYDSAEYRVFEREREKLLALDVPRFETTHTSETQTGVIGDVVETPGVERVRDRITSLTGKDIARQEDFITLTCTAKTHITRETWSSNSRGTEPQPPGINSGNDAEYGERVTNKARELFETIRTHAEMKNGVPTWLTKDTQETGDLTVKHSENGMYSGRAGIGVFAAAVAAATECRRAAQTAEQIATNIIEKHENTNLTEQNLPLGFGNGVFAGIYGVLTIGRLLGDEAIISASGKLLTSIPTNRLKNWCGVDVMGGVAGGILTATAVAEHVSGCDAVPVVETLANRLVTLQETRTGQNIWVNNAFGKPVTGFAHGATGIGYAFARAYEQTSTDAFKQASHEAFEFTATKYDKNEKNWEDVRPHTTTNPDAWCYGRSGIVTALTSAEMHTRVQNTAMSGDEIQHAHDAIQIHNTESGSELCCGASGRLQLAAYIENHTSLDTHRDSNKIRNAVKKILTERVENGWVNVPCHSDALYNASLFQGVAGVGYSLLYTTHPVKLPTILLIK